MSLHNTPCNITRQTCHFIQNAHCIVRGVFMDRCGHGEVKVQTTTRSRGGARRGRPVNDSCNTQAETCNNDRAHFDLLTAVRCPKLRYFTPQKKSCQPQGNHSKAVMCRIRHSCSIRNCTLFIVIVPTRYILASERKKKAPRLLYNGNSNNTCTTTLVHATPTFRSMGSAKKFAEWVVRLRYPTWSKLRSGTFSSSSAHCQNEWQT